MKRRQNGANIGILMPIRFNPCMPCCNQLSGWNAWTVFHDNVSRKLHYFVVDTICVSSGANYLSLNGNVFTYSHDDGDYYIYGICPAFDQFGGSPSGYIKVNKFENSLTGVYSGNTWIKPLRIEELNLNGSVFTYNSGLPSLASSHHYCGHHEYSGALQFLNQDNGTLDNIIGHTVSAYIGYRLTSNPGESITVSKSGLSATVNLCHGNCGYYGGGGNAAGIFWDDCPDFPTCLYTCSGSGISQLYAGLSSRLIPIDYPKNTAPFGFCPCGCKFSGGPISSGTIYKGHPAEHWVDNYLGDNTYPYCSPFSGQLLDGCAGNDLGLIGCIQTISCNGTGINVDYTLARENIGQAFNPYYFPRTDIDIDSISCSFYFDDNGIYTNYQACPPYWDGSGFNAWDVSGFREPIICQNPLIAFLRLKYFTIYREEDSTCQYCPQSDTDVIDTYSLTEITNIYEGLYGIFAGDLDDNKHILEEYNIADFQSIQNLTQTVCNFDTFHSEQVCGDPDLFTTESYHYEIYYENASLEDVTFNTEVAESDLCIPS